MKKIIVFVISSWLIMPALMAQYRTDTWFFGYLESNNAIRDSIYVLKFTDGKININYSKTTHSFESDFASISDNAGNLLLYTNGCMIADSNHQIITNGDGLNPGLMASELCGHYGYISDQGAVFVPVPGKTNDFWLIHMAIERDTLLKTKFGPLYASYITGSNGSYEVTSKNTVLLEGNLERFAIVKHGDGVNWWIMVPEYNTNNYHSFLINESGITEKDVQQVGPVFDFKYCANGRGANVFSNLGKYYVRNNVSCGPVIFKFDRCKGTLEDPLAFVPTEKQFGGGGVAFYNDDSKMYYCTQNQIRKIDLNDFVPMSTEIASYDSTYATTLGNMFMGPDSNIYINTQSSGLYIHKLIPKNNAVTFKTETFRPKLIKLPVRNTRTIPVTINYALGPKYTVPCDSFVSSTYDKSANEHLSVYPNPAQSELLIDLAKSNITGSDINLRILNATGAVIFDKELSNGISAYAVNLSGWEAGLYIINVSNGKKVFSAKVVIVR